MFCRMRGLKVDKKMATWFSINLSIVIMSGLITLFRLIIEKDVEKSIFYFIYLVFSIQFIWMMSILGKGYDE